MPSIVQALLHFLLTQADSTTHVGRPRHGSCCSEAEPASETRSVSYACGLFSLYHVICFYSTLKSCSFPDLYEFGPAVGNGQGSSEMVRTGMTEWWLMAHWPCAKVTATQKFSLEPSHPPAPPLPWASLCGSRSCRGQNRGVELRRFPAAPVTS